MKMNKTALTSAAQVVVGNLFYALTMKLFLLPHSLVVGGTTGLAQIVDHFWGMQISGFVLVFNVVMLGVGWAVLGRGFALTTIASSFLYPAFLELWNLILGDLVLTQELLLNTLFSGLGIGVSLGLVLRAGASTGGMDIPPLILNKFFRIPVSAGMYAFDFCILLPQMLVSPPEKVLYGILLLLLYTMTLDKMLLLGSSRTELKIVSAKSAEISQAIMTQVDRGVTLLHGEGGYTHGQTDMIFSVVTNRELVKVERIVHSIDPECFMVVSRVSEVRGKGFSISKT